MTEKSRHFFDKMKFLFLKFNRKGDLQFDAYRFISEQ